MLIISWERVVHQMKERAENSFRSQFWRGGNKQVMWDKQSGLGPRRAQRSLLAKLEAWYTLHQVDKFMILAQYFS